MSENNHDTHKTAPPSSSWGRFWSRLAAEPEPSAAHHLYERLVQHARFPLYYQDLGVADTPEGRFEILALHVGLTIRRLYHIESDGPAVGQALFDLMIADLDDNLRELGVGDLSVGKQVKRLASQFYARLAVLNEAFEDGGTERLGPMLTANVFGSEKAEPVAVSHLAAILAALEKALDRQPLDALKSGQITLPDEAALRRLRDRCSVDLDHA